MRKTKIICTLGPAVDTEEKLRELMLNGMDCARFNFSHGTHEEQKVRMDRLKKVRDELNLPIPMLLDTKGPEIRVKTFKDEMAILKEGQDFTLFSDDRVGDENGVGLTYSKLAEAIKINTAILVDDGKISLKVKEIVGKNIVCKVLVGGKISNRKSINIPGVYIPMDYISPVDEADIIFGIQQGIDFVAASFVRTARDVYEIRKVLDDNGAKQVKIISKIESVDGVKNLDSIIEASDGIMVARGDMGVELSFKKIPQIQKKMIEKCYRAGKFVITATQMLESMIQNARPTRAEVSDVANAIYDGTTCIMLSGESAAGKYPIEAVKAMSEIAEETEKAIDYKENFANNQLKLNVNIANAISIASCNAAHYINAKALVVLSKSGRTARLISSNYPAVPIIAEVIDEVALRQLNLYFAVKPILTCKYDSVEDMLKESIKIAKYSKIVKEEDLVVVAGGSVIDGEESDMIKIQKIK